MIVSKTEQVVDVWHNILWSKYKAGVFSCLYSLASDRGPRVSFFQIAETDHERSTLGKIGQIDTKAHAYPYKLLFQGSYFQTPGWRRLLKCSAEVFTSRSEAVILAGYHQIEFWGQLIAAKLSGKKVAVFCDSTINDQPQTFFKSALKRLFLSQCALGFCYGERSADYLAHHGLPRDKIVKRCQAAYLPSFYDASQVVAKRLQNAPSVDAPRFLYVGRLSEEKNLERLLLAFQKARLAYPRAELHLIGDGPLRAGLERSVPAGLLTAIKFHGAQDQQYIYSEMLVSTCIVLPSLREAWGLVVNEALANGCPALVSAKCGCIPELIVPEKTGLVFDPLSIDSIASSLEAAPSLFCEQRVLAEACLEVIRYFTPENAALAILGGCERLVRHDG